MLQIENFFILLVTSNFQGQTLEHRELKYRPSVVMDPWEFAACAWLVSEVQWVLGVVHAENTEGGYCVEFFRKHFRVSISNSLLK